MKNKIVSNKEYWDNFYTNFKENSETNFARFCFEKIKNIDSVSLIELGCGNGRDSIFFSSNKIPVLGVDLSKIAIENLNNLFLDNSKFFNCDFANIEAIDSTLKEFAENKIKVFYSRFSMHCVNETVEDHLLNWIRNQMRNEDMFFIETRTTEDELFKVGIETDGGYFTDHYRRFIDYRKFENKINQIGFEVDFQILDRGLAKYKEEDPKIMRFILKSGK